MSTAVWIVMCSEPAMRAPASGLDVAVALAHGHQAGHLVLGELISLRPKSARLRSATLKSMRCLLQSWSVSAQRICASSGSPARTQSVGPGHRFGRIPRAASGRLPWPSGAARWAFGGPSVVVEPWPTADDPQHRQHQRRPPSPTSAERVLTSQPAARRARRPRRGPRPPVVHRGRTARAAVADRAARAAVVAADLVEADRMWPADPEHRDGADHRDDVQQLGHGGHQAGADPLREGRGRSARCRPTSSIFTISATTP